MRKETRIYPPISRAWPFLVAALTLSLAAPLQAQTSGAKLNKHGKQSGKGNTSAVSKTPKDSDPLYDGEARSELLQAFKDAQGKAKAARETHAQIVEDLAALKAPAAGLPVGGAGLDALASMTAAIKDVAKNKLQSELRKQAAEFDAQHTALDKAYKPFKGLTAPQILKLPDAEQAAVNGAQDLLDALNTLKDDSIASLVTADSAKLNKALEAVPNAAQGYVDGETQLANAMDLNRAPVTADIARAQLAAHESDFADVLTLYYMITAQTAALSDALVALNAQRSADNAPPIKNGKPKLALSPPFPPLAAIHLPGDLLVGLQTTLADDLAEVNDWLTRLVHESADADTSSHRRVPKPGQ